MNFDNPENEIISVHIKDDNIFYRYGSGWADRNNSMIRLIESIKYKIDTSKEKNFY